MLPLHHSHHEAGTTGVEPAAYRLTSERSAVELRPQSGAGGMLEWLERLPPATRKILIHVNNTNPILDEDSEQAAQVARHGIEVAWDGMEIVL